MPKPGLEKDFKGQARGTGDQAINFAARLVFIACRRK
jgi:hypothetical protein